MVEPWRSRRRRSRSGAALILIALSLTALLGLAGLAVDGGFLFLTRQKAQAAVDAAVLAAAFNQPSPPPGSPPNGGSGTTTMQDAARHAAALNNMPGTYGPSSPIVLTYPYQGDYQKVYGINAVTYRPTFLAALGFTSFTITTEAAALHQPSTPGGISTSTTFGLPTSFNSVGIFADQNGNMLGKSNSSDCSWRARVTFNVGPSNSITGGAAGGSTLTMPTFDDSRAQSDAKTSPNSYFQYSSGTWKKWNPVTGVYEAAVNGSGFSFSDGTGTMTVSNMSNRIYVEGGNQVTMSDTSPSGFLTATAPINLSSASMSASSGVAIVSLSTSANAINLDRNAASGSFDDLFLFAPNGTIYLEGKSLSFHGKMIGKYVAQPAKVTGGDDASLSQGCESGGSGLVPFRTTAPAAGTPKVFRLIL